MNIQQSFLFILTAIVLIGCSSTDDDNVVEEQPIETIGAYTKECKWIYHQMNRHYLWRNDMPDSLSCDYATDPVTFFKSLLSSKDRFSYCERNTNYTGTSEIKKDDEDNFEVIYTRANSNNVLLDTVYSLKNKKIGYFCYLKFENVEELAPIIGKFKNANIDELVIDLRYNPGGYVSTCKYLCNSVVNERGYGKIFQSQGFNDVLSAEMQLKYGSKYDSEYYDFPTKSEDKQLGMPLYGLNMNRIFVLTSSHTASASEALIVCLRPYNSVIVIGERTVGKGVGSYTIRDPKYKYELHPITLRYFNANEESTPDDGIEPDYIVKDGYQTRKKEIGHLEEPLLNMAISLIVDNMSRE